MTKLNFRVKVGNSEEIAIFCLHTIPLDSWYFEKSLEEIDPDFTIYMIDLPNHGKSPDLEIEKLTFQVMADKIEEFRKYLRLRKIHLLGHGIGGFVSQYYALKYFEHLSSLILVNTASNDKYRNSLAWNIRDRFSKITIQALDEYKNATDDKSLRVKFTQSLATYFSETNHEFSKMLMDNSERIATETYVHLATNEIQKHDTREKLRRITCKTLIMSSLLDVWPKEASQKLRNDIIQAKYIEINAGHFPMLEQPNKFWKMIFNFVES